MFVTNWISTTKIQKISEITNFFRHYFLSRTEVKYYNSILYHINACYEPGTDEAIRTSLPVSLPLPAYW